MRRILPTAIAILALALAACGGGDDDDDDDGPTATATGSATEAGTATEEPADDNAVAALEDVESAVVRIVAEGSFRDPDFGEQLNAAGSGSGFIIDPSGIAVTNNHVVTGAALLQVYVSGEDEPRNARILGASECSDLAVIDIDGDGFPYLAWFDDEISTGLDVYAAGYPLGDPEFTLTRGIVSKSDADGESNWASVDGVVEHDATINPGNSGGPLLDESGRVVGINYASGIGTNQFFAIRGDIARPVLDQLTGGEDVTSIGVNGQAIILDDGTTGIWVASVKTGSPADEVGVKSGDIITRLEGLLLALDGTMADYCDILRTNDATDELAIEIVRFDTSEVYEGRLNGDSSLELSFSFAEELEDQVEEENGGAAGPTYAEYVRVEDDSGRLIMDVPAEWSDIDGSTWLIDGEEVGPQITAATSIDQYLTDWTVPGAFFGASAILAEQFDEEGLLDFVRQNINLDEACTYVERQPYEDPAYTGFYDLWENCGGAGVFYLSLAATPADGSFIITVQVQVVTDADLDAMDTILSTFFVPEGL